MASNPKPTSIRGGMLTFEAPQHSCLTALYPTLLQNLKFRFRRSGSCVPRTRSQHTARVHGMPPLGLCPCPSLPGSKDQIDHFSKTVLQPYMPQLPPNLVSVPFPSRVRGRRYSRLPYPSRERGLVAVVDWHGNRSTTLIRSSIHRDTQSKPVLDRWEKHKYHSVPSNTVVCGQGPADRVFLWGLACMRPRHPFPVSYL